MYDELDFYLGRRLKNYVAEHPLPAEGRKRLLKAAANEASDENNPASDFSILDQLLASQLYLPVEREGFQAFLTQSNVWQFKLAAAPNLAT
jgi:hypothetical protein